MSIFRRASGFFPWTAAPNFKRFSAIKIKFESIPFDYCIFLFFQHAMQDYLVLNRTGDRMPLVGFGTARISDQDTEQVVYNAIKNGYR